MHDVIDLRSDTVTRPCPAMRRAMLEAEVGDAVYGEDPTINLLEAKVARLLGKEAAIYVPTGTMANTLAIRLCGEPGDEIICEANCHPVFYEAGGSGAFSGVLFKTVEADHGLLDPTEVSSVIYPPIYYRPRQRALLVENTSNRGGGTIYPLDTLERLAALARNHGLAVHMDGARLWNASAATGISMAEYAAHCDTVSVCFSKGMGAPVGSALAGTREDIDRAWHYRHMLGGTWRQAGILAAGALYAMEHNFEALRQDHEHAATLAAGVEAAGLRVLNRVETNMVYFALPDAARLLPDLATLGIRLSQVRPGVVRCVTHRDVDGEDIQRFLRVLKESL